MKHEKARFMFHVFMSSFFSLQSRDTDVVGIVHSRKRVLRKLLGPSHTKRSGVDRRWRRTAHVCEARGWNRFINPRRSRHLPDAPRFGSLQFPLAAHGHRTADPGVL